MPLWFYNLQKRSSSARTVSLLHQSFITSYRFLKVTSHLTGILMVYLSIFSLLYNQSELNIELYWYYTCTGAPAGFTTPLMTPVALLFLVSQNPVTCLIECLTLTLSSLVVVEKNLFSRFLTMATIPIMLMVPSLHPCACKSTVIVNASVISGPLALIFLDVYISKLRISDPRSWLWKKTRIKVWNAHLKM